ncbi:hypothetical protein PFISCL1PPCAC_10477 [Pristionchus fissidentatus]|uniref:Amino acid transporter transmembrane domain-containing protein n=1 Tax=Pristionchus fissidentatus TaxID=1538716 RepID=A0AAV5VKN3_9BILA|nr:hypothetical protein PFISCL1PPCAC_10477 [Pristionchus fissidentatus]
MGSRENQSYHEDSVEQEHHEGSNPIGAGVSHSSLDISESRPIFHDRGVSGEESLSPEAAFIHMVKAMLGTGLLSLPLAFKHSGLFLGLILMVIICIVCLHCMRQVVHAAHFVCSRNGRDLIDYANIMRGAVELGPEWLRHRGYFFKQLVNVNMFVSQLGFCCVYVVFMADNLEDFFSTHTSIHLSKGVWMILVVIPLLGLCSIRRLPVLAPFCVAANVVYICAVAIVLFFFISNLKPVNSLPWFGSIYDLPLFFGTVMFAFEGVAVVMPIENRMREPSAFIGWNGVLNSSCLFVLAIFAVTGFYGYLSLGDAVKDTATLNLPDTTFYQAIKLMFVGCIMISYPLQFYVPMERVEKWITRKIAQENQTRLVYAVRFGGVLFTLAIAELIPHLALFISLIGAFSGASMALLFPPFIELLVCNAKGELTTFVICKNAFLLFFALLGFTTGTYAALSEIFKTFSN